MLTPGFVMHRGAGSVDEESIFEMSSQRCGTAVAIFLLLTKFHKETKVNNHPPLTQTNTAAMTNLTTSNVQTVPHKCTIYACLNKT